VGIGVGGDPGEGATVGEAGESIVELAATTGVGIRVGVTPRRGMAVVCVAAGVSDAVEARPVEVGLGGSRDAKGGAGESVAAQALTSTRVAKVRASCIPVTLIFLRQPII